jgi:predicted ATPase
VQRHCFTGAPGAGKTTLLAALRASGHAVVDEAATDVIAEQQAAGVDEPWLSDDFITDVLRLQQRRQDDPPPSGVPLQLFDRSPLCTLALALFQQRPVPALLTQEVDRIVRERVYEPAVLLVRPLGFVTPSAARRISYADSLRFEAVHEQVYRDRGFTVVEVLPASVSERVAVVEGVVLRR